MRIIRTKKGLQKELKRAKEADKNGNIPEDKSLYWLCLEWDVTCSRSNRWGWHNPAEVTSHRGLISLTSVLGRRRWRDGRRADGSTDTTQTDEDWWLMGGYFVSWVAIRGLVLGVFFYYFPVTGLVFLCYLYFPLSQTKKREHWVLIAFSEVNFLKVDKRRVAKTICQIKV